jgi:hypothetical protein
VRYPHVPSDGAASVRGGLVPAGTPVAAQVFNQSRGAVSGAAGEGLMARTRKSTSSRRYGKKASEKVAKVMREKKRGTLRSGGSGKKVSSRKQAIAIGLSEARRAGAKVPEKR